MNTRSTSSIRRRWERTPLRVRLVAALLLLVTGALTLISVASVMALQGYMMDRVDDDLEAKFDEFNPYAILQLEPQPQVAESDTGLPSQYAIILGTSTGDEPIIQSRFADDNEPDVTFHDLAEHDGRPFTATSETGGKRWRVLSLVVHPEDPGSPTAAVAVGAPLDTVDRTITNLVWIDLLVGGGVLAGLAGIGVALVRASLYPLREIEQTAAYIAAGNVSRRVPERDPRTEVGRLSLALNAMLRRIESAMAARAASENRALASEERMRRFIADASHELRTPLTTVRGFAELYRQRDDVPPDEAATLMRRIEDEATRMGLLVEDLLLLARLDRERPLHMQQVDLLAIAADIVTGTEVVSEDHPIELTVGRGPFVVIGDELRLRQVVSNLVNNAVRHTPPGTSIAVRLNAVNGTAQLQVADAGPGMPPEVAERVFERFYRADKARSRRAGGTGLGLAIVAALVKAHNGSVSLQSTPGRGSVFTITLALHDDVLDEAADRDDAGGRHENGVSASGTERAVVPDREARDISETSDDSPSNAAG